MPLSVFLMNLYSMVVPSGISATAVHSQLPCNDVWHCISIAWPVSQFPSSGTSPMTSSGDWSDDVHLNMIFCRCDPLVTDACVIMKAPASGPRGSVYTWVTPRPATAGRNAHWFVRFATARIINQSEGLISFPAEAAIPLLAEETSI